MGPTKRPSEGDLAQAPTNKIPKIEPGLAASPLTPSQQLQRAPGSDFSGSVKKKLASSSRTGQACDRCKVRKIRCDPRPEGCSPCQQNRTPCKTTDRITGRATTRGHAEAMEAENNYLRSHVAELQAQLKEMGVEPRPAPAYNGFSPINMPWPSNNMESEWGETSPGRTSSSPLPGYAPANGLGNSRPLPQFKQSCFGDNYLGISSPDSLLSNIKGTSLSVFGYEIDITDFVQNDADYDKGVMSYNHFLKVALREERVEHAPLPPYPMLREYATWYLRSLNPYTMLIDKPTLMHLVWRTGNEPNFQPTPAECVCIHMMLATLKYQISVRNGQTSFMEESHQHYRYSLSFFSHLMQSHTWQDIQALTLICHHLRNFPKPGAAWIMTSATFLLAIELGFHRSTKAWADTGAKMDRLEIETRKRVFWTLHALATNLSGKLGRPMPIAMEDFDVEFPEPLNDCVSGEDMTNLTPYRKCSFQVGIQIAKYTVWSSQLYRNIYAVNQSPRAYDDTLKRLEAGIQQWKDELPSELKDSSRASQEDYIFALYLEYWHQEYRLLLHHPAVCRSKDPDVINANLDKCLTASQKMLHVCNEMRKIRSLDFPWINVVVYIAAVFTTLFIHHQRKDQMSSVDMTKLRNDMTSWIDLMGECGQLLGSGDKLKKAIRKIVERSLGSINESIVKRTATESLARVLQAPPAATPVYGNGNYSEQYSNATSTTSDPALAAPGPSYTGIQTSGTYSYGNGTPASVPQQSTNTFEPSPYTATQDPGMTASHAAALAAASSATAQRPDDTYAYNAQVANGQQPAYSANAVTPHDWRQWTRTYMQGIAPPGEYLNTATTLMALGGREGGSQGPGQEDQGTVDNSVLQAGSSIPHWPGVQFSLQANGHVGPQ